MATTLLARDVPRFCHRRTGSWCIVAVITGFFEVQLDGRIARIASLGMRRAAANAGKRRSDRISLLVDELQNKIILNTEKSRAVCRRIARELIRLLDAEDAAQSALAQQHGQRHRNGASGLVTGDAAERLLRRRHEL